MEKETPAEILENQLESLQHRDRTEHKGPTPRPINWGTVRALAQRFCPIEDIADAVGFSRTQLERRCQQDNSCTLGEYYQEHAAVGRNALRTSLFDSAVKDRNPTIQKFLAKNMLGMTEDVRILHKPEVEEKPTTGYRIVRKFKGGETKALGPEVIEVEGKVIEDVPEHRD